MRYCQITKVQKGLARLIDSYTEGYIKKSEFEPRIQRLRQRLTTLQSQAQHISDEQLRQTELRLIITHLDEFAAQVNDGLDTVLVSAKSLQI